MLSSDIGCKILFCIIHKITPFNTIFVKIQGKVCSSFQSNLQNLDPSCKMDLDFWVCFGKENPPSYSRIMQDI